MPDFIVEVAFENLKIVFVIEIDEPYTLHNNEIIPIHYTDFSATEIDRDCYEVEAHDADSWRDNVLLEKGLIIIRFAEEQIVNQPIECCKYIYYEVKKLLNGDASNKNLEQNSLTEIEQWSYSDSIEMGKSNYRLTYLTKETNLNQIFERLNKVNV